MRFKKFIPKLLIAAVLIPPAFASAQNSSVNTFSPYTYYGIGDIIQQGTATTVAMGGTGLGYRSATEINLLNPASYSAVGQRTALFHVGLEAQNFYLKSQSTSSSFNTFNVHDIALQLPLAKSLGLTVGITPFSTVGYRISDYDDSTNIWENIGDVHYLYSGSGGVNRFNIGVGYGITKWLSVGAQMLYYHGNIIRNYQQTITSVTGSGTYVALSSDNHEYVNRIMCDFGVQARLFAHDNRSLELGAYYNMGGRLYGQVTETVIHSPSFTSIGYDNVVNTTYRSQLRLPDIYSGGLCYQSPKFSAALDYSFGAWGVNSAVSPTVAYRNTNTISAGIEFTPKPGDVRRVLNRWSYRLGARYGQYYMTFNDRTLDQMAITLGVGIPLGVLGNNKVDVGIELGRRGVVADGLVRENYFKVSVGLSLFGNDYWFVKYQYD